MISIIDQNNRDYDFCHNHTALLPTDAIRAFLKYSTLSKLSRKARVVIHWETSIDYLTYPAPPKFANTVPTQKVSCKTRSKNVRILQQPQISDISPVFAEHGNCLQGVFQHFKHSIHHCFKKVCVCVCCRWQRLSSFCVSVLWTYRGQHSQVFRFDTRLKLRPITGLPCILNQA